MFFVGYFFSFGIILKCSFLFLTSFLFFFIPFFIFLLFVPLLSVLIPFCSALLPFVLPEALSCIFMEFLFLSMRVSWFVGRPSLPLILIFLLMFTFMFRWVFGFIKRAIVIVSIADTFIALNNWFSFCFFIRLIHFLY